MVFQAMAKFIEGEGKGTIQCYNYHNRMKSRYKTIENIIKELQEQHGLTQEEIKNEEQRMIKQVQSQCNQRFSEINNSEDIKVKEDRIAKQRVFIRIQSNQNVIEFKIQSLIVLFESFRKKFFKS